jgi:hypothetical protein
MNNGDILLVARIEEMAKPYWSALSGDRLLSPNILYAKQQLVSQNGEFKLAMQSDCDLRLLSNSGSVIQSSQTESKDVGCYLQMTENGNVIIQGGEKGQIWSSGAASKTGGGAYMLKVENSGQVRIYQFSDEDWKAVSGLSQWKVTRSVSSLLPPLSVIYRYFNPSVGDSFYTNNYSELFGGRSGWIYKGKLARMLSKGYGNARPIYRYYKGGRKADHFYTWNAREIGTTRVGQVGKYGYKCEGIIGYCFPNYQRGTVKIYRYWSSAKGDHLYTTNYGEYGAGRNTYKYEGVLCYAYRA